MAAKRNERAVLLCYRVADMPGCPSVQSFVGRCERCGKGIWVSLSSPAENVERWCIPCARDAGLLKSGAKIEAPTRDQLRDIKKYRQGHA